MSCLVVGTEWCHVMEFLPTDIARILSYNALPFVYLCLVTFQVGLSTKYLPTCGTLKVSKFQSLLFNFVSKIKRTTLSRNFSSS